MKQLEACLHSGCSVHFRPSLSSRPSFYDFSKGLVTRLPPLMSLDMYLNTEPKKTYDT